MEQAAPLFHGHYFVSTPLLYPAFPCHPVPFAQSVREYFYSTVHPSRPHSRASSRDMAAGCPSDWTGSPVFDGHKAFQAPYDMDTLKAAIQTAKTDCGEVRQAIESSTFKPRERAFTRLINMCGRQKEAKKAVEVFTTMCEYKGVRPNTYTYSALISACSHAGDCDAAIQAYRRMKKAAAVDPGCRPNQVTYNAIVAATERGGRYDVCLSCFEDMVHSDACPDSVTYCSAINCYQKLGKWKEAEKILAAMHSQEFTANLGVYATMIDHYATHSSWKAALDLFLTMQMLGQTVDERCCRGLMRAFEAGQQPEMAYQLIEAMWANDITIETTIYVAALRLMTSAAMWEHALEITKTLHQKGEEIPFETMSLLVDSMQSAGNSDLSKHIEFMNKKR